jgi:hypothetical protein
LSLDRLVVPTLVEHHNSVSHSIGRVPYEPYDRCLQTADLERWQQREYAKSLVR